MPPDDSPSLAPPDRAVPGLTDPQTRSLTRFPIRTRESEVTRSGWRLEIVSREGEGAIVVVEASPAESFYRGEGILLGWTAERLEAAYRELRPRDDGAPFELNQLG